MDHPSISTPGGGRDTNKGYKDGGGMGVLTKIRTVKTECPYFFKILKEYWTLYVNSKV